ncbi:hypothetical protein QEN19_001410 [Hanseniaspora menglaensis]
MFKSIIDTYNIGVLSANHKNVESIDASIQELVFKNKLLLNVTYNKGPSILIDVRCNINFIYYLDMLLKLLNVVDIQDDNSYYKFTINGKHLLNNNYNILTNLNIHNIVIDESFTEENIPTIDIQNDFNYKSSNNLVTIDKYDIKNKYRLDFFESWRQANYIMFKHSKNILKLSVKDSNDLWSTFFLSNDFNSFSKVISKNNLINLNDKIPVRAVFKTSEKNVILRQPMVENKDTLENLIEDKLKIENPYKILIQGFLIQNLRFKLIQLYENFHSPDGFLYIVIII